MSESQRGLCLSQAVWRGETVGLAAVHGARCRVDGAGVYAECKCSVRSDGLRQ